MHKTSAAEKVQGKTINNRLTTSAAKNNKYTMKVQNLTNRQA